MSKLTMSKVAKIELLLFRIENVLLNYPSCSDEAYSLFDQIYKMLIKK